MSPVRDALAGWVVRLPTEAEWEKAARGGVEVPGTGTWTNNPLPARRYPWGDEPDPTRANYDETGIGATCAVGCFPGGASPYGVLDMSGNVWEWTQSLWGKDWQKPVFKYPYNRNDGREDLDADADVLRVVRGGSYFDDARSVRCAVRDGNYPDYCSGGIGFRVVASPT